MSRKPFKSYQIPDLWYSKQLSNKVGERLHHDPMKLLFTPTHGIAGKPNVTLKRTTKQTLAEMLVIKDQSKPIVLYKKIDMSILELELDRGLDVTWMGNNNRRSSIHHVMLKKIDATRELKRRLSMILGTPRVEPEKIRIFQISADGRMQMEFESPDMIYTIPESEKIYAEVISSLNMFRRYYLSNYL